MLFLGGLITRPGAILGDMIVLIKAASKQIKQTRPPINTLTLEMIRTKTTLKPKCKTKAAEGRHLLPCVLHMLKNGSLQKTDIKNSACVVLKTCRNFMMFWVRPGMQPADLLLRSMPASISVFIPTCQGKPYQPLITIQLAG